MLKFIQISDLHLLPRGGRLKGVVDPEAQLRLALADIAAKHADAAALIVSGDISDNGDAESFALFHEVIADYELPPLRLTVGNHDRRDEFARAFPEAMALDGFAHSRFDLGPDHVGILLDTWEEGVHSGALCAARLDWLRRQLEADRRPAFLFMHHQPFKPGMKRAGLITLTNGDALWETIAPFREQIRHLFFGHVHRSISGSWHGLPFTVVPATAHQGVLDFESSNVQVALTEPYYAVTLVDGDAVVVHPYELRTPPIIETAPSPGPSHMVASPILA